MNEGFSDIWGAVLNILQPCKIYLNDGEDIEEEAGKTALRSMVIKIRGQPTSTYGGTNWRTIICSTQLKRNELL
jgi:hypothetical protein